MKGKRLLAVLLAALMTAGSVGMTAFAEDGAENTEQSVIENAQETKQAEETENAEEENEALSVSESVCEPQTALLGTSGATAVCSDNVYTIGQYKDYATFETAAAAAVGNNEEEATFEIYGKVEISGENDVLANYSINTINFVGKSDDAEISLTGDVAICGRNIQKKVTFKKLTLSHVYENFANDYGQATKFFTCWTDATYEDCTFPNGSSNNLFGNTVYKECTFQNNNDNSKYNLWMYTGDGVTVTVEGCTFEGRSAIKVFSEDTKNLSNGKLTVKNNTFKTNKKAAIVVDNSALEVVDLGGNNISDVTCDSKNLVWIDENFGKFDNNVIVRNENGEIVNTICHEGEDNTPGEAITYEAVATIDNVEYATLKAAIESSEDGDIVTLNADVVLDECITIENDITLDFNDKKVTTSEDMTTAFRIHADVTVKNGNMDTSGFENYCFIVGYYDKKAENPNETKKTGSLVIENGTYKGDCTVAQVSCGTLTINGGEYSVKPYNGEYKYLLNCKDEMYKAGEAKIYVKGGSFENYDPANNAAEGAGTNFIAPGYAATADGDNYSVAKTASGVAKAVVGGEDFYYATLQDAVDNADNDSTITLCEDIEIDIPQQYLGTGRYYYTVINNKKLVIDFNEKTIRFSDQAKKAPENTDVVIFALYNNSDVTFTGNGTVIGSLLENPDYDAWIAWLRSETGDLGYQPSKLTVENGTYISNGLFYTNQQTGGNLGGEITINDGYFASTTNNDGYNQYINVSGNTMIDGKRVIINGGTFDVDPRYYQDNWGSVVNGVKGSYMVDSNNYSVTMKTVNGKKEFSIVSNDDIVATVNTALTDAMKPYIGMDMWNKVIEIDGLTYSYTSLDDAVKNAETGEAVTLFGNERGMTVKVDKDEVVAGEEFKVEVELNSEDIAHAEYTLAYDAEKFALVSGDGTGKITFAGDSGESVYENGKILGAYTFKAIAQTEEATGTFSLEAAKTATFAEARRGIKVEIAKPTDADVTISAQAFDVTVKVDGVEADSGKAIRYDGKEHAVSFDVKPNAYKNITTTIKMDGEEVKTIKKPGTYEIEYTVTPIDGYEEYTNKFTLAILAADAYFTEVNLDAAGKDPDYIASKKLVLVYTELDDVAFRYNDVDMIEVTKTIGNYQYEGDETTKKSFAHVYAYVTDVIAGGALDAYKEKITPFVIEDGYEIKKINEYTFDINNLTGLDDLDPTTAMGVYGGVSVYYNDTQAQINILKADVNGDKKVTPEDTTRVTLAVYGK